MSKINHVRSIMMGKCRAIKLAVNKLKDIVANVKEFSPDDKVLVKIVLDNLFIEIRRAIKTVKETGKLKKRS